MTRTVDIEGVEPLSSFGSSINGQPRIGGRLLQASTGSFCTCYSFSARAIAQNSLNSSEVSNDGSVFFAHTYNWCSRSGGRSAHRVTTQETRQIVCTGIRGAPLYSMRIGGTLKYSALNVSQNHGILLWHRPVLDWRLQPRIFSWAADTLTMASTPR